MGRTGLKFYGNGNVRVDEDFRNGFTHVVCVYDHETNNWEQLGEPYQNFADADAAASKFERQRAINRSYQI